MCNHITFCLLKRIIFVILSESKNLTAEIFHPDLRSGMTGYALSSRRNGIINGNEPVRRKNDDRTYCFAHIEV